MENFTEEQIQKGLDKAYKEAGHNAYFGNGFKAGIEFAMQGQSLPIDNVVGSSSSKNHCSFCGNHNSLCSCEDDKLR